MVRTWRQHRPGTTVNPDRSAENSCQMSRPSAPLTRWSFSIPPTAIQASLARKIRLRRPVGDIGAAQGNGTLVADHATGECDEDRRQDRHAWPRTPSGDSMPPPTNPLRHWQYYPGKLSFLTVPASPGQIVECGLSAPGMTAVSCVIRGISGRGSRGTGHRNHELENHDDEITMGPRVLRNLHCGCVRFGFSRRPKRRNGFGPSSRGI